MSNKKAADSRRKLFKSIAAGSGAVVAGKALPESWTKPVVDSVMLTAHAETTGEETPDPVIYSGRSSAQRLGFIEGESTNMFANVANSLISPALADDSGTAKSPWFSVEVAGGMADVKMQGGDAEMRRGGMLNLDGTQGSITSIVTAPFCGPHDDDQKTRPARVESFNESQIVIDVKTNYYGHVNRFTVPVSPSGCTAPPDWYECSDS